MRRRFRPVFAAYTSLLIALLLTLSQPMHAQSFRVIYRFAGHSSSSNPIAGVTVDRQSNLYGTTAWGGAGHGTVYELQRTQSGFIYHDLHNFADGLTGRSHGQG